MQLYQHFGAPPSNQNTSYQNTLIKLSNTDGSVTGSFIILPLQQYQSNTSINAFICGMSTDTTTNKMYLTFTIGDPTSGYHTAYGNTKNIYPILEIHNRLVVHLW